MTSARSERGAMLVMGLPFLFLIVGVLFYFVALCESLLVRAHTRDAADAAALSTAVFHARGMNLVAITNQVMLGLVAVTIVVRLLEVLMTGAIATATALAFMTHGASLSVVTPAQEAKLRAQAHYASLSTTVPDMLRAMHAFELGIQHGMPVAAQVHAHEEARAQHGPYVVAAVAVPGRHPMPIEPAPFSDLCARAEPHARRLIDRPFQLAIAGHLVTPYVQAAIDSATRDFTRTFCADFSPGALRVRHPAGVTTVPFPRGFPSGAFAGGCGQGRMSAHRVIPGLQLGAEAFQVRSIAFAAEKSTRSEDIVAGVPYRHESQSEVGLGGRWARAAGSLARVGTAQAEYFFDMSVGEVEPEQWLWEPRWRARLRRFRPPSTTDDHALSTAPDNGAAGCGIPTLASEHAKACSAAGNAASPACPDLTFLSDLQPLVVH